MAKLSFLKKVALGELGAFRNGVNFSKDQMGSGLKLINVKDIFGDSPWIDFEGLDLVDLGNKGKILAHTVEKNDLFFVRSSVKRDGIGLVRLADNRRTDAIHCGFVIRFRLQDEETDALFLTYLLRSPGSRQKIINLSGGSAIINISQSGLACLEVDLPPLPTQRKIAAILSAYDDLIENNLRRIKILEEMAQNLYREWFVKFRFPGHQHARFTDSPLGRIPEGWEVVPLGQLADQVRDSVKPDSVDPETPYFGLEHLPRKSIALSDWGIVSEVQSTKLLFKHGDILFGKIRPYFHKVGVAPVAGVCSSDTIVIRPRAADWFGLVLGCTSSSEFVEYATATSQGTKMPRANWDVLVNYEVPVPPQPILGHFSEFLTDIVSKLHNFIFRNRNLRRTRDLLLPRLISGEVDVSKLDIAVPEGAVT